MDTIPVTIQHIDKFKWRKVRDAKKNGTPKVYILNEVSIVVNKYLDREIAKLEIAKNPPEVDDDKL